MAKIKITLELDLEEIRNIWYLIQNVKMLMKYPNKVNQALNSMGLVLKRLEDLNEKIEPLVER